MESEPDSKLSQTFPGRRTFLQWLSYGLGAVAAAVLAVPLIGYLFGIRPRKVHWVPLPEASQIPVGQTRLLTFVNPLAQSWDGITANTGVYVRKLDKDKFLVFAVNCAHLGCPVSWFPESGLFMCPCHGGVYYANGERASGPPPRGLFHCVWRVNKKGGLEIQAPHYPTLQDTLTEDDRVT
jgi:Rieske Fe-S protein